MAMEPITLFTRYADPARVARKLRELFPAVRIDGPDDQWQNAVIQFGKLWKKRTLTLTHSPDYYAEPNWSNQMSGMRGYFSMFPDTERKQNGITLTTSFRFSLGTVFEPDFDPDGDPRLQILFDVANELDAVLFTPSSMRDANGRILFGAGGEDEEDPEAVWPRVLGAVSMTEPVGAAMHEASRPKSVEEDDVVEPPTAHRVARRALALTAVTARGMLEQEAHDPDSLQNHQELLAWVNELQLDDELEPEEWEVLQRPLGRLDDQMKINAIWRVEGLVVLSWALDRFEIPPHDQLVQVNPIWNSCNIYEVKGAQEMVESAKLRSREKIATLRNRLFALHWRLRNFGINREVLDFAEFAKTCWFGPLDLSGIPLVDGDLAVRGKRIDRADDDTFSVANSISMERHKAANWLWDGPKRYSEASEST